jgi:serine-type D-Ala-D-Ala carboxypeptidase (penicillin-binding protein 5/6)
MRKSTLRRARIAAALAGLTAVITLAGPGEGGAAFAAIPPPAPGGASAAAVEVTASPHPAVGGPRLAGPGVIVNYPSRRSPRVPKIPADAFVLADATTGQVLAARNPHGWYGPASTLKILAAISLIPVLNPTATVVASKRAVDTEPDDVGLKAGQRYEIADLFRALLLISGNDAAVALAEATGSFSRGIALMNAEAQRLQAYDTVAREPNGLDARGQHVSAYDEALIARQALRTPAFLAYDQTRVAWFPITARHRIELFNQDQLLGTYRGFIGGKTGWTTPAHATYVGMARRHGHTLIVTLLHAVPGTLFTSATAMLDWGFRMEGELRPVGYLASPLPATPPASHPPAPAVPASAAARAGMAGRLRASSSSEGIAMPFTVGSVALAALAFAGYGFARRRRAARR